MLNIRHLCLLSLITTKSYSYCLLLFCLFPFKPLSFYTLFDCWLEWCVRISCLNCSTNCFAILPASVNSKAFTITGQLQLKAVILHTKYFALTSKNLVVFPHGFDKNFIHFILYNQLARSLLLMQYYTYSKVSSSLFAKLSQLKQHKQE